MYFTNKIIDLGTITVECFDYSRTHDVEFAWLTKGYPAGGRDTNNFYISPRNFSMIFYTYNQKKYTKVRKVFHARISISCISSVTFGQNNGDKAAGKLFPLIIYIPTGKKNHLADLFSNIFLQDVDCVHSSDFLFL